ncbi:PrpF domain-containing protein [Leucobacter albus]|uniref:PrpF domain-containing protein n=1 Tax=Leucobacter albus TaxID=272210 RepID=A0ABW3TM51_9MICO
MTDEVSAQGVPCMWMRGGTSKGAFLLASDVPEGQAGRADLARRMLGSPDPQQIDGIGGAHPLTSKIAIVSASTESGVDLDYEFLQVGVETGEVSRAQTCGNLLAGVVPFAIERGILAPGAERTNAVVRLTNTGSLATVAFASAGGVLSYGGDYELAGVPGSGNPIEVAVQSGGKLLPTGVPAQEVLGVAVTLIDNGMPVVVLRAADLGISGDEAPGVLEEMVALRDRVESIRRAAGKLFGLGDVTELSVPKMMLVSQPRADGDITVRAFIPRRVHRAVGVLMAAGVAAASKIPGAVGAEWGTDSEEVSIEHPAGIFRSRVKVERDPEGEWRGSSISVRTARKLFDGRVFPMPVSP